MTSATFILIVSLGILSSVPTVQERAYRKWFNEIEPQLWTNHEKENPLPLPSISIITPTNKYICAPKGSNCAVSVNQEQILRYLRLIEVSRAMRFAKAQPESQSHIEIGIYQETHNSPGPCSGPIDLIANTQSNFGNRIFTGIVVERDSGITLGNLLSLVEHSCAKNPK